MTAALHAFEVSHHTARRTIRETLAATADALPDLLKRAAALAPERVIVSTCGRFELYLAGGHELPGDWPGRLATVLDVPREMLACGLRVHRDAGAARHLLRVAAGLESPLIGDPHVLGQVRAAYLLASGAAAAGPILAALFRAAIHAGRRVRHESGLHHAAQSYAQLAIGEVLRATGDCGAVIVVGSGTLAHDVAHGLAQRGTHRLTIVSRHAARGAALAAEVHGRAGDPAQLPDLIRDSDAVITCTSSTCPVVSAATLRHLERPVTLVDLGMPRNVDDGVRGIPRVQLRCLDDLSAGDPVPPATLAAAERIVAHELAGFQHWLAARMTFSTTAARRSAARRPPAGVHA